MARSAIAAAVAIAVVVGVIALVNLGGGDDNNHDSPAVSADTGSSTSVSPTRLTPASSTTGPPRSVATTTTPATTATTATQPVGPPPPAPGSQGTVVVYDGSDAPAATARAVATLQAAGYAVRRTRSIHYRLSRTTVYYDSDSAAAAHALVNAHVGVLDAAKRPRLLARTGTLIVVVAPGYAP